MKRMMLVLIMLLSIACTGNAWTDEEIANAIFWSEGGYEADYLYGIVSVSYDDIEEARRICLNTIRNQRIRYKKDCENGYSEDFLTSLGDRYCPVEAHELNKYWLKNVKWFLNNPKEIVND